MFQFSRHNLRSSFACFRVAFVQVFARCRRILLLLLLLLLLKLLLLLPVQLLPVLLMLSPLAVMATRDCGAWTAPAKADGSASGAPCGRILPPRM